MKCRCVNLESALLKLNVFLPIALWAVLAKNPPDLLLLSPRGFPTVNPHELSKSETHEGFGSSSFIRFVKSSLEAE
jgi:hypothetical protein